MDSNKLKLYRQKKKLEKVRTALAEFTWLKESAYEELSSKNTIGKFYKIYSLKNLEGLKALLSEIYDLRVNQRKLINFGYLYEKSIELGIRPKMLGSLIRLIEKHTNIDFFKYNDDDLKYFENKYGIKFTDEDKKIIEDSSNPSLTVATLIYLKSDSVAQEDLARDFIITLVSLRNMRKYLLEKMNINNGAMR